MRAWGPAPVLLFLLACAANEAPGTYAVVQPAADGGGERHIRVTLNADGSGALSSAFSDRPSRYLAQGTWRRDGNRITLVLDQRPLVFQLAGNQLVAKEWDRAEWGENGPGALFRVDR